MRCRKNHKTPYFSPLIKHRTTPYHHATPNHTTPHHTTLNENKKFIVNVESSAAAAASATAAGGVV